MIGKLINIAQRSERRAPMEELNIASVTFEHGIENDSRGKFRNNRQVTVLTSENWRQVCKELNTDLSWTFRRANLLIEGLDLENTTGKQLRIGDVQLEITGELDPCNRMDEQHEGLTDVLKKNWRGGVTCKLLSEGSIRIGDEVLLTD